jgi:hypothetical protein
VGGAVRIIRRIRRPRVVGQKAEAQEASCASAVQCSCSGRGWWRWEGVGWWERVLSALLGGPVGWRQSVMGLGLGVGTREAKFEWDWVDGWGVW